MLQISTTSEMVIMPSDHDVTVLPPEECLSETAFRLCKDYLHGTWRHIQMSQMVFRKVRYLQLSVIDVWCLADAINYYTVI